jgi:hypothetical protein
MVEDPALYMALGINAFWLLVPKFLMAMMATQIYRAVEFMSARRGGTGGSKDY